METEKNNYKKQQKLSFAQFLTELPNFIVVTISGILTGSLIVWMDFLDSLGHVLRTGAVAALARHLSKDLHYEYNYGISKIENMAVLFCDGIILCGLLLGAAFSVHEIISPRRPDDLLIYVVLFKIINVSLDIVFLKEQWKLRKLDKGNLSQSNYTAALGMVLFDVVGVCSLILVWGCKNSPWTWYFSPVISIFLAAYLTYKCVGRLRNAISELIDKTLPEEDQMKILKVMTRHYAQYSEFHFVKSHKLSGKPQIDLVLSFSEDTNYNEMVALKNELQEEISGLIEDSTINISIM